MTNYKILISIAATIIGLVVSVPHAHSKERMIQCWAVDQNNVYYGDMKLFLAPDRARIEIKNSNTTIICKAPTWRVSAFNRDGKVELSKTLNQWTERGGLGLHKGLAKDYWSDEVIRGATKSEVTYAGVKAIQLYLIKEWLQKNAIENREVKLKGTFKVLIAKDSYSLPKQELQFLRALYRSPALGSVPLFLSKQAVGFKEKQYQTFSVKRVSLPQSEFEYPQNYKQVKAFPELVLGYIKSRKNVMVDFLDGMGGNYEEEKGKK